MTLIAAASKSRRRISQVVEVTRATTPANPSFKVVPQLDSSQLNVTQNFERSAQVQANRMGGKQVGGSIEAGGTLAVPLKHDPAVKELLESLFSTTFTQVSISGGGGNPRGFAIDNVAVSASGTITIEAGGATDGDTAVVNGVTFTFRTAPALPNEVALGAGATNSASNLQAALDASTNPLLTVATYTVNSAVVTVRYNTPGTAGNAFTLATNDAPDVILSGATLSGGVNGVDQITCNSGSFIEDGFHVGDQVLLTNPTTGGNAITAANMVTISSVTALAIGLTSALGDIFTTDEDFGVTTTFASRSWYAKAGTDRKTFTHEVAYLDLNPIVYEYYKGNEVNTGNINIPTSGEVTMEMQMVGIEGTVSNTIVAGGTYAPTPGTVSFAGSVTGSALYRNGVASVEVESLTLNIDNQRSAKFAVGQATAALVEEGDFNVEAQMSLYFKDKSVTEQYLAGERTSLEVVLADQQDGHKFAVELPNIVFTTGDKGLSGMTVSQNCTAYGEEDTLYQTKARVWIIPAASAT